MLRRVCHHSEGMPVVVSLALPRVSQRRHLPGCGADGHATGRVVMRRWSARSAVPAGAVAGDNVLLQRRSSGIPRT